MQLKHLRIKSDNFDYISESIPEKKKSTSNLVEMFFTIQLTDHNMRQRLALTQAETNKSYTRREVSLEPVYVATNTPKSP